MNNDEEIDRGTEARRITWVCESIEKDRRHYKMTDNPLFVCSAFLSAHWHKLPIPDWVSEYFYNFAFALNEWASDVEKGDVPEDPVLAVLLASGINKPARGRSKFFHEYIALSGWGRWQDLGSEVLKRVKDGDKQTFAIEAVAMKFRTSLSQVHRAWRLFDQEYCGNRYTKFDARAHAHIPRSFTVVSLKKPKIGRSRRRSRRK
jgi:hypothetical protein